VPAGPAGPATGLPGAALPGTPLREPVPAPASGSFPLRGSAAAPQPAAQLPALPLQRLNDRGRSPDGLPVLARRGQSGVQTVRSDFRPAGEAVAAGALVPLQRLGGLGGMFEGIKQAATDPSRLGGLLGGWPAAFAAFANQPGLDRTRGRQHGANQHGANQPGANQAAERMAQELAEKAAAKAAEEALDKAAQKLVDTVLQMEPKKLRLLAARMYPFISQRIKTELGKDRERSGMITGLHR
jgi:hypothetical protein